jgi:hypothetical protein
MSITVNITDFSTKPFGRYPKDGQYNAERFRIEKLLPAIEKALPENAIVHIYMDGLEKGYDYSSSFLEEAFGGLVRVHHFKKNDILQTLKIESKDDELEDEIKYYIAIAK